MVHIGRSDRRFIIVLALLTIYAFLLLVGLRVASQSRDAYGKIDATHLLVVIGACALCIEVVNQITFYISLQNYRAGRNIKGALFWTVFTIGYAVVFLMVTRLPRAQDAGMSYSLLAFAWDSLLACTGAVYSLNPRIRFLFLYGKYAPPGAGTE